MPRADPVSAAFVRQVRSALAHLYDYAYLQNHPLATAVDPGHDLDRVSRGQKLRRLLLDSIEALRPQQDEDASPEAAWANSILTFHFVDGMSMMEIAALRALGQRQAYRELERSVEAVARILHDRLQQLAGDTPPQGEPGDLLQTAQAEVTRLSESLQVKSLDLHQVLQQVLELVRPTAARAEVHVTLVSQGPWPPVLADRVMLRQALLSLLTYALDALARGDLTITVTPAEGELYMDIVASSGQSRTYSVLPPPNGQARVSLPVCEALLTAQGGHLQTRHDGRYWRARISLPTPGCKTILVVDDNRDQVALMQRYLAGHDLKVVGALDGEQALRLAAELQPRLITLDVMMPREDGWDILQKLKTSPTTQHIPVLVCSVLHAADVARTMGAAGYIAKPVSQVDLLKALRQWLGPLPPAG